MDWACVPQLWIFLLGVVCPDSWWWYSDWYSDFSWIWSDYIHDLHFRCSLLYSLLLCTSEQTCCIMYLFTHKTWIQRSNAKFKIWPQKKVNMLVNFGRSMTTWTLCTTRDCIYMLHDSICLLYMHSWWSMNQNDLRTEFGVHKAYLKTICFISLLKHDELPCHCLDWVMNDINAPATISTWQEIPWIWFWHDDGHRFIASIDHRDLKL